ncbi:negative transcriptional regulator [Myriangium duriaei CBS 260.36]|uniref:Negative transcriptional regulator n=1 Tax=Myriangium duriaei CBS 260.36 TaxID=1168546 RepID=A0A9P4MGR7_9PEZI|nr:negative transcriptional regulator [Myriangium duriaei CBS 260.36]
MYLRAVHADATLATLRQLVRDNPLGVITTAIPSKSAPLIQVSHVPFLLDFDASSDEDNGVLRGHLTRVNPQAKTMIESLANSSTNTLEQEVLVLFTSPAQHYVTPKYYTETKPSTGKVVPTWNYAAAQCYGKARIFHDTKDPKTGGFILQQVNDLSRYAEESLMGFDGQEGRQTAWGVKDAPERYIELLSKSIIGIEITVDRFEGKFKMSQELREGDRDGVVAGFDALGTDVGKRVAEIVKERQEVKQKA